MNLFVAKWIKRRPGVRWVTGWNHAEESWHVDYRTFHCVSGLGMMDDVILSVKNVSDLLLFLTGFLRGSKRALISVIRVYGWTRLIFWNAYLKAHIFWRSLAPTKTKASSTPIRFCLKTEIFSPVWLTVHTYQVKTICEHAPFQKRSPECRIIAGLSFTCRRTKTELFQYGYVLHHILIALHILRKRCYRISIVFN